MVDSGVAKKKKSSERLDREISAALGKKSKLWPVPEKQAPAPTAKPTAPTAPASTAKLMTPTTPAPAAKVANEAATREKVCRYCKQPLHWAATYFECGGEGEGACSYWSAIGDYDRAGRPADIEGWLDGWIQRELGADWAARGWDRGEHAKAIRTYFRGK